MRLNSEDDFILRCVISMLRVDVSELRCHERECWRVFGVNVDQDCGVLTSLDEYHMITGELDKDWGRDTWPTVVRLEVVDHVGEHVC